MVSAAGFSAKLRVSVSSAKTGMLLGGGATSVIVPVAVAVASVTFVSLDRVTVKVSSLSVALSVNAATAMVCVVSPASKVSVSDAAVKSSPLVAVSPDPVEVA